MLNGKEDTSRDKVVRPFAEGMRGEEEVDGVGVVIWQYVKKRRESERLSPSSWERHESMCNARRRYEKEYKCHSEEEGGPIGLGFVAWREAGESTKLPAQSTFVK